MIYSSWSLAYSRKTIVQQRISLGIIVVIINAVSSIKKTTPVNKSIHYILWHCIDGASLNGRSCQVIRLSCFEYHTGALFSLLSATAFCGHSLLLLTWGQSSQLLPVDLKVQRLAWHCRSGLTDIMRHTSQHEPTPLQCSDKAKWLFTGALSGHKYKCPQCCSSNTFFSFKMVTLTLTQLCPQLKGGLQYWGWKIAFPSTWSYQLRQ